MKKQLKQPLIPPPKDQQADFFPLEHWEYLGYIQRILLLEQIHSREKAAALAIVDHKFDDLPAKLQSKIIDYFEQVEKPIVFFNCRAVES